MEFTTIITEREFNADLDYLLEQADAKSIPTNLAYHRDVFETAAEEVQRFAKILAEEKEEYRRLKQQLAHFLSYYRKWADFVKKRNLEKEAKVALHHLRTTVRLLKVKGRRLEDLQLAVIRGMENVQDWLGIDYTEREPQQSLTAWMAEKKADAEFYKKFPQIKRMYDRIYDTMPKAVRRMYGKEQ